MLYQNGVFTRDKMLYKKATPADGSAGVLGGRRHSQPLESRNIGPNCVAPYPGAFLLKPSVISVRASAIAKDMMHSDTKTAVGGNKSMISVAVALVMVVQI